MSQYETTIAAVVQKAVSLNLSADAVMDPLIDNLARLSVSSALATGAKVDHLVEIIRHKLDEKVVEHEHKFSVGGRAKREGGPTDNPGGTEPS